MTDPERDDAAQEVLRIFSRALPRNSTEAGRGRGRPASSSPGHKDRAPSQASPPILTRSASEDAEPIDSAVMHARVGLRWWSSESQLDELCNLETEDRRPSSKVRFGEDAIREFAPYSPYSPELQGNRRRTSRSQFLWSQWNLQNQKLYARSIALPSKEPEEDEVPQLHASAAASQEDGTPVQKFAAWIRNEFEDLDWEHAHLDSAKASTRSPLDLVKIKMKWGEPGMSTHAGSMPPSSSSGVKIKSIASSGVSGIAKLGSFSLKSVTSRVSSGKPSDKWKKWGEERQRAY